MQLPSRLGGFELTERLGAGAMGTVYTAVQTALGRRVVVKTLHPHLMEDPDLVARFQREARHAAGLQHPNTVQVYDFGREGEIHYIAMEYVDGLDLKEILTALGAFPAEVVTLVMRDLCRGMEAAHGRDLVHRDLKPANLMITRSGVVKVMDFGLARETAESSTLTRHGSVMGSAAYMSPEQAQGFPVDHRTDVFSAGLVGYEIASGRRAFPGESYAAVLRAVVFDEIAPLESHRPGLPPELYDVLRSMTVKDLASRCPSMGAARDVLEALGQRLGLKGEDRILAEFVRRADEERRTRLGGTVGGTRPTPRTADGGAGATVAGFDATEIAGDHTVPTDPGRPAAAPGTQAGATSGRSAIPTPGANADGTARGSGPGVAGPADARGSADQASAGRGARTDGPAVGSGGPGRAERPAGGAPVNGASDRSGGSAVPGGRVDGPDGRGARRALLAALLVLALGTGGFFAWRATQGGGEPIRPPLACCFPDGTCEVLAESICLQRNGISGPGAECEPNPCAQPSGACCLSDGTCRIAEEEECRADGGEFRGAGTTCAEAGCRSVESACCLENGSCRLTTREACGAAGGEFRAGGVCEPNPCPQPDSAQGACCRGETCTITTRPGCASEGGRYQGDRTTCAPNPCAPRPEPAASREFTITTRPNMTVAIDGGPVEPNEKNSFRATLRPGTHRFRVRNVAARIDTVFVVTVKADDPNTILLDMHNRRVTKSNR